MSLVEAVLSYDGTDTGELKAAVSTFEASEAQSLIRFCETGDGHQRVAATWITKALLERNALPGSVLGRLFACLETETAWEPLLHLLQSVRFAPAKAVSHREAILRQTNHGKTLVRVWALDAFVHVALESGAGLNAAREAVSEALSADKASLRARARHLAPRLGL